VGLRSALIDGACARMYAGRRDRGRLLPETEFAETELKFRAMQDALLGRLAPRTQPCPPPALDFRNVNSLWGSVVAETLVRIGRRPRGRLPGLALDAARVRVRAASRN
jgi:hypothetical protein